MSDNLIPLELPGDERTVIALHATGGDEHQLVDLARDLLPGAHLLAPRGEVLEGGSVRRFFARRSQFDLDLDDLALRADRLADALADRLTERDRSPERTVALGYSNGANMAIGLLYRRPTLMHSAVLLRPMLPYRPDPLPDLSGHRLLVASGRHDPYGGIEAAQELIDLLRETGAQVTVHLAEAGHELTAGDITAAREFLSRAD